ncbi:MAG: hypothetical protein ACLT98_18860 [Eggerthellaceae bacterium]
MNIALAGASWLVVHASMGVSRTDIAAYNRRYEEKAARKNSEARRLSLMQAATLPRAIHAKASRTMPQPMLARRRDASRQNRRSPERRRDAARRAKRCRGVPIRRTAP